MAGTFEGVSDLDWSGSCLPICFLQSPPSGGVVCRILPTLLYILSTGCRWCDLPRDPHWASKSAAHRWLQRWQDDGTLAAMRARLLGLAEERGMIQWQYGGVDGSFSSWQRGR
jgi:hypothetical protein